MANKENEVIRILKRGDGRTLCQQDGRLMIRFDSEEDRDRFAAGCRLLDCVNREDINAAAHEVFDALNLGLISDESELLELIADDDARELVNLEFSELFEAALSPL